MSLSVMILNNNLFFKFVNSITFYCTFETSNQTKMENEKQLLVNAIESLKALQNVSIYENKDIELNIHWVQLENVISSLESALLNS